MVGFELKVFSALIRLCGYEEELFKYYTLITNYHSMHHHSLDEEAVASSSLPPVPEHFKALWRHVIAVREALRKKKQEHSVLTAISVGRAASIAVLPTMRSSNTVIQRSDSLSIPPKYPTPITSVPTKALSRRNHIKRMMSCSSAEASSLSLATMAEQKYQEEAKGDGLEAEVFDSEELATPLTYEDYLDQLLQKLDLLMDLDHPWDLNESESEKCNKNGEKKESENANEKKKKNENANEMKKESENANEESNASLTEGQQKIMTSLKKNNAVIVEEKGVIPESKEELICTCVMKYLLKNNTVSPAHLRESLQHRTENAKNKQRIFEEGLQFLRMIHDFPQASRLFLLGMFHEMTVFSNLYIGGFHNSKRHREGSYGIDYLENCEGA